MENKKVELSAGLVIVSAQRDARVEAFKGEQRGHFVTDILNRKQAELGNKEFDNQRNKLEIEARNLWEQVQKTKAAIRELTEQSLIRIMDFAPLEKAYRIKLTAEGCSVEMIEKTLLARRADFDFAQRRVQERLRPPFDPDADFKKRVLNPATREEALKHYLLNHVNRGHFTVEVIKLLFELNERR